MELERKDELCESSVDYKDKEQTLINDCKDQLKVCLEKYKESNEFKPQDMDNILGVLAYIIDESENNIDYIHDTKDKDGNGFFQYALKKIDLPIMQWLMAKGNTKHHSEKEYADVIAFCTEQLSPTEVEKRETVYAILKSIIEHYKTDAGFLKQSREYYLPIMIMLQLKHRVLETKFVIEEELLTPFVQQNGLSDLYQTTVDVENQDNNTLAHIIVEQHDADELHKLMNKNYISKEVRNSAKRTVYDLAFDKLRVFTQNTTQTALYPEKSKGARCCYYMLDKYFAGDNFDKKKNCCDNHPVLKKYSIDPLKTSPSVSVSSSISSSESSSSAEKIARAPVLADEPEQGNCCTKLCYRILGTSL